MTHGARSSVVMTVNTASNDGGIWTSLPFYSPRVMARWVCRQRSNFRGSLNTQHQEPPSPRAAQSHEPSDARH